MKPETKLGIFTVIGLFVLGFSLYFLGGFSITRTYDVNIKFQDVSGLPVKAYPKARVCASKLNFPAWKWVK